MQGKRGFYVTRRNTFHVVRYQNLRAVSGERQGIESSDFLFVEDALESKPSMVHEFHKRREKRERKRKGKKLWGRTPCNVVETNPYEYIANRYRNQERLTFV
jgi:hypothetical protein